MIVIPNRVSVAAVMLALALAGGLLTLALLAKPTQAEAQTEHFDKWVTGTTVTAADCLSEEIAVENRVHFTGTTTYDADGGVHVHLLSNVLAEGVGLTSGDKYVVRERGSLQNNVRDFESDQLPATSTQIYDLHLIHQGPDTAEDDFVDREMYHVTINANGEFTVEHGVGTIECY